MNANELRSKYIEFFKSKNHVEISGQSLIPENDPSVLFTMAGMHPLVPYLLGEKHPMGTNDGIPSGRRGDFPTRRTRIESPYRRIIAPPFARGIQAETAMRLVSQIFQH